MYYKKLQKVRFQRPPYSIFTKCAKTCKMCKFVISVADFRLLLSLSHTFVMCQLANLLQSFFFARLADAFLCREGGGWEGGGVGGGTDLGV
jgi:hypothetical protein